MRNSCLVFLLIIGLGVTQNNQVFASVLDHIFTIKASGCKSDQSSTIRIQTGFKIKESEGIMTALHGVCGCKFISAIDGEGNQIHNLKIQSLDVDRDVALIGRERMGLSNESGLVVSSSPLTQIGGKTGIVYGHPQNIDRITLDHSVRIRNIPLVELKELAKNKKARSMLVLRNSPRINIEVISVEGFVQGGLSGGPLMVEGHLLGILNGGLNQGVGGIGWAVPISQVELTPINSINNTTRYKQLEYLKPQSLFSFESENSSDGGVHFGPNERGLKVLVLPFERIEDCLIQESNVERGIVKHFSNLEEKYPTSVKAKYLPLPSCISSDQEAAQIGKEYHADIVVWGDQYEYCFSDSSKTCVKYTIVSENVAFHKAETRMQNIRGYGELGQGYLHSDVNYVVGWITAFDALRSSNPAVAARRFKGLLKFATSREEKAMYHLLAGGAYAKVGHRGKAEYHLLRSGKLDKANGAAYLIIGEIQKTQKVLHPVKPYLLAYKYGDSRIQSKALERLAELFVSYEDSNLSSLLLERWREIDPSSNSLLKYEIKFYEQWKRQEGKTKVDSLRMAYFISNPNDPHIHLYQGLEALKINDLEFSQYCFSKVDSITKDKYKDIKYSRDSYGRIRKNYVVFNQERKQEGLLIDNFLDGIDYVDIGELRLAQIQALNYLAYISTVKGDRESTYRFLRDLCFIQRTVDSESIWDSFSLDVEYNLERVLRDSLDKKKNFESDSLIWKNFILSMMVNNEIDSVLHYQKLTGLSSYYSTENLLNIKGDHGAFSLRYSDPDRPIVKADTSSITHQSDEDEYIFSERLDKWLFFRDYYKWKDQVKGTLLTY